MTDKDSQMAFQSEWIKYTPADNQPFTKIIAEHFWQASEARIMALLDSPEMVEIICQHMIGKTYKEHKENGDLNMGVMFSESCAISAISAIKTKLQGE